MVKISPGLLPEVQVTEVEVAAVTGQLIPSRVITYKDVSVGKFVPAKVTEVPPVTGPYLGVIDAKFVVRVPWYSIEFRFTSVSLITALTAQVYVESSF